MWDGDPNCEHTWQEVGVLDTRGVQIGKAVSSDGRGAERGGFCRHCSAWRGSLGLEPDPELFISHIVQVFREVRRVLRRDGVLFLNIGDSYAGAGYSNHKNTGGAQRSDGGKQKHTSSGRSASDAQRVGLYDTDGTPKAGYRGNGYSSQNPDDEHIDGAYLHTPDTSHDPDPKQVRESCLKIQAYMNELRAHLPNGDYSAHSERVQSLAAMRDRLLDANRVIVPARVMLESILDESSQQPQADYHQSGMISACLSSLHSFSAYAQVCGHRLGATSEMPDYTEGIASLYAGLAHHIQCTSECCSLVLSWLNLPHIQPQYTTSVPLAQLPPKSLMMMPARVAIAMQADGWLLRSEITLCKVAPMPESVTDRPTSATEKLYMFARQGRYFYDGESVRVPNVDTLEVWAKKRGENEKYQESNLKANHLATSTYNPNGRNAWNWMEWRPEPLNMAHFAAFPSSIPRFCIKAGTSQHGCCGVCGAGWRRVVEQTGTVQTRWAATNALAAEVGGTHRERTHQRVMETTGWQPSCKCGHDAPIVPATVLDPFMGSGTTLLVATELGRDSVGIELKQEYIDMAKRRIMGKYPLFAYASLAEEGRAL